METTKIRITKTLGAAIQPDMIGLFFEDINYAADGGLYAEMIENRSFEFVRAGGNARDYYFEYDGMYGWAPCPANVAVVMKTVQGSPLSEANPHYLRVTVNEAGTGFCNRCYGGIFIREGMEYHITFFARCVSYHGTFTAAVVKDGRRCASSTVSCENCEEETYNYFRRYRMTLRADETVSEAEFALLLSEAGTVEFDFISMFPADAAAGLFRRDLFEALKALKPGFLRFPGGCIVEGNTLVNRYRYKDSLTEPWNRKNNWNRWAVHGNCEENNFCSCYSHYNQTLGLGYYEYFLLCELIGAAPLPVMNVGFACQYQSTEQVSIDSPEFARFVQDALDLIEFANGGADTEWGAVRAKMGHPEPFGLSLLGIGNEQWQTERADFFERYTAFEKAIHAAYPSIRLIGSAGPDITSDRYTAAWDFYRRKENRPDFVYAVDEHYYVKPEWLYEHVDFYDDYPRAVKVFSGEYAAHPASGMNRPDANTLEGALAEAAFLTNLERNADVVVMASYAPLFARLGYAQWSPDLIWFDAGRTWLTASYYVQQLYSCNLGDVTLDTAGQEKEAAKNGLYYSISYSKAADEVIVKIVNANDTACPIRLLPDNPLCSHTHYRAQTLAADGGQPSSDAGQTNTGIAPGSANSAGSTVRLLPEPSAVTVSEGSIAGELLLPAKSFTVFRF